jgi:hypothetical protein
MRVLRIGWGGRIRTFTILINSEVSYRLDHAPAEGNTATTEANERSAGPSAQNTLKDSMPIVLPEAPGDVVAHKQ